MAAHDACALLANKLWNYLLDEYPEFATYRGFNRADDKLDIYSLDSIPRREKFCKELLQDASQIKLDDLSSMDRVTTQMLVYYATSVLKGLLWGHHYIPISDIMAPDFYIAFYTIPHTLSATAQNCRDYISRLRNFPKQMIEMEDLMKEGLKIGLMQRKTAISENVITRLLLYTTTAPEETIFMKPLKDLSDSITEREELKNSGIKAIKECVQPAFIRICDFLKKTYLPHCMSEPSIERLPGPPGRYMAMLRYYCDFQDSDTAENLHQMGLNEVTRIQTEMKKIQDELGFKGTYQQFDQHLRGNKDLFCETEDELMAYIGAVMDKIKPTLHKLFRTASSREVKTLPTTSVGGTLAFYTGPSLEAGEPGTLYVNVSDLASFPKYEVTSLMLHEAEPGHHLQSCIAMDNEELPLFRRIKDDRRFSESPSNFPSNYTYTEGWAMYCETLGEKLGLYDDIYTRFGHYCQNIGRACRVVVDTGIHALGWSEEQATDYLLQTTTMTEFRARQEISRYTTFPAQACCYKVGEFQILDIRKNTEKELGDLFDVREFHDVVLECGQVPMSILRGVVDRYIKERLQRGAVGN